MDEMEDEVWNRDEGWFDFTACKCEHPPNKHGWLHCDVENCPCQACWQE